MSTTHEKRTDVGYGRPPKEHQFKPGNKPPPRKRSIKPKEPTTAELLWTILQEDVRTTSAGRVRWMTKAEVLYRKAHELADHGSPAMRRLIMELMMRSVKAGQREPEHDMLLEGVHFQPGEDPLRFFKSGGGNGKV